MSRHRRPVIAPVSMVISACALGVLLAICIVLDIENARGCM